MKSEGATIPSLDGIRAIAVGLVFFAHSGLEHVVPGALGVTIFFVLSGFLITTLMRIEHGRTGVHDDGSIEAQYRDDGAPQDNFVLDFITRAMADPDRLAGFAAVLSDGLSGGGMADAELYRRLTPVEVFGSTSEGAQ